MTDVKLANWLDSLLRFRDNEYSELCELNGFSESDAEKYQVETNDLFEELKVVRQRIANRSEESKEEKEIQDLKNKFAYLAADFENYKKRVQREQTESFGKGKKEVILRMLDVHDDMQRLYDEVQDRNLIDDDDNIEIDYSPVDSGFEMIFEKFEKSLYELGCEKLKVGYGDEFDVELMEAISTRIIKLDEYLKPDTVAEIYSDGWKMDGKVIRPAKVIIGKKD